MSFQVGSKTVGASARVCIVAEASANHHRDLPTAERLVIEAARAGADCVKFQTALPDEIATEGVEIPRGHDTLHDAWLDRLGKRTLRGLLASAGLPRPWHRPLKALAEREGIEFLSTPFGLDSARFLVEEIGIRALKVASGDLTFTPLLEYAAGTTLPIFLSTGGATLYEVIGAVNGPLRQADLRLAIMHCVSSYPCDPADANLRAIPALRQRFGMPVGWSDHTLSIEAVPVMAVMLGATVLEKHFCVDDDLETADTRHSLAPDAFARMVAAVRAVPAILGDGKKHPRPSEMHDRLWARRDPSDWLRPVKEAREGRWE